MTRLSAETIEAFSGVYLSPLYDEPQPTPEFHREAWDLYCGDSQLAAIAAPRNHAKSTALTHDFVLANVLFREQQYVIIVGSSEELAIEHLGDISNELRENEELIRDFGVKQFLVDMKTDIIVECVDGYKFRIIARGAEQKIRGKKWLGKRPGLIVCDDLEDDEQVESRDRREKFRHWFFRACQPALRDGGKIRVHGTILHIDSLLARLMKDATWKTRRYKAHAAFSDFSQILWPEKFPEERLKLIRAGFINQGDSAGYSQEYLNDPRDNDDAYLKREQFLSMKEEDYEVHKRIGVGVDFAISKQDKANRTSFTVGGKDVRNWLHFVDQHVGRWDATGIISKFFEVAERWNPECFWVEDGQIWQAIWPVLREEMTARDKFFICVPLKSLKDKASRGRIFQRRMQAGSCRFDKKASWYAEYEEELLVFTGYSEAVLDDQFDSSVNLVRGMETLGEVDIEDFYSEEDLEFMKRSEELRSGNGRNATTGY